MMTDIIFREYDIRGKVGTEFIIEQVYALTQSIVSYFVQKNPALKTVLVGMDARDHSPEIKDEVIRALADAGLDVIFIGVCPTPVLYFGLYTLKVDAGIMITASHNPPEFNGIKLCLGKHSVWGLDVQEIKELYKKGCVIEKRAAGSVASYNLVHDYCAWISHHFRHLKNRSIQTVFDCGNGTAGVVMPELITMMGWRDAQLLYADVDGSCPNHEADPVKEKNMVAVKNALAHTNAQCGIGFDGDSDRMAAMTKSGYLVAGDQMLALFSKEIIQKNPGASIVMDIKSSSALLDFLNAARANPHLAPSGHAIIKDYMRKHKALLGGELSCHFFFADRYFGYDDGIYAAFRLIEMITQEDLTLEQLVAQLPQKVTTSEFRIACAEEKKQRILKYVLDQFAQRNDVDLITIDGIRARMDYGWGIVRASNTQSELCLRFESDTSQGLDQVREDFITMLSVFYDRAELEHVCR